MIGLKAKAISAVIGFMIISIALMGWQIVNLKKQKINLLERNAALEQIKTQLIQDVKDQQETISGLREQIAINDKINSDNAAAKQAFINENSKLKQTIRDLKNEKPEIREYLNQHKPAAIVSMLKSLSTTASNNKDRGNDSTAPIKPGEGYNEAEASVPNQRMWRPADHRLQYSTGLMQC